MIDMHHVGIGEFDTLTDLLVVARVRIEPDDL